MTPYRIAIDLFTSSIDRRARAYRNLVVAVVMLVAASIGLSLGLWSAFPLTLSLLVVPVCGLFFWMDAKTVHRWRSKTLASWVLGEIDLAALCQAIRANPLLPTKTVDGMLET